MEKLKPKISKKVKKVLSSVLAATLVLGSVPASTFLGDAIQVRAAASYSPQKYGVGVLCRDLTTGDKGNFQCTGTLQVKERGFALRQYLQQCWYGEIQIQQDESRLRGDIFSQRAEGLSGAVQSVRTDQSESDGIHNE